MSYSRISAGEIKNWSCTKLADFFDRRTPNWMADNLSLEAVMALDLKLRGCSPQTYMKAYHILRLVKHSIARRKN